MTWSLIVALVVVAELGLISVGLAATTLGGARRRANSWAVHGACGFSSLTILVGILGSLWVAGAVMVDGTTVELRMEGSPPDLQVEPHSLEVEVEFLDSALDLDAAYVAPDGRTPTAEQPGDDDSASLAAEQPADDDRASPTAEQPGEEDGASLAANPTPSEAEPHQAIGGGLPHVAVRVTSERPSPVAMAPAGLAVAAWVLCWVFLSVGGCLRERRRVASAEELPAPSPTSECPHADELGQNVERLSSEVILLRTELGPAGQTRALLGQYNNRLGQQAERMKWLLDLLSAVLRRRAPRGVGESFTPSLSPPVGPSSQDAEYLRSVLELLDVLEPLLVGESDINARLAGDLTGVLHRWAAEGGPAGEEVTAVKALAQRLGVLTAPLEGARRKAEERDVRGALSDAKEAFEARGDETNKPVTQSQAADELFGVYVRTMSCGDGYERLSGLANALAMLEREIIHPRVGEVFDPGVHTVVGRGQDPMVPMRGCVVSVKTPGLRLRGATAAERRALVILSE